MDRNHPKKLLDEDTLDFPTTPPSYLHRRFKMLLRLPLFTAAAAATILGVLPKDQILYIPDEEGKWHCLLDPSILLRPDQINDGFCDCPDGSDEPATHACSYPADQTLFFYCENKGFFPRLIERHKLNDGVCDYDICCDGSDEWKSGHCPDKCEQVKQQYNQHIQDARVKVSSALETRKQYVEKGKAAKQALVEKLATVRQAATAANNLVKLLEQELLQAEKEIDTASDDLGGPDLQEFGEQIQRSLDAYEKQVKQQKLQIMLLQNMVADLAANYNPNFNDAAVKKCVKLYGDFVSNKADDNEVPALHVEGMLAEISLALETRPTSAITIVPTFSNMWHHYYSQIISLLAPTSESAQLQSTQPHKATGNGNKKTAQLTQEVKKAENALLSAKAEASILETRLTKSYGEDDVLRGVEGEWILQNVGDYTYKIGLLDAVYQDNTLVGRFSGIDGNAVHFSGGSKCWNGPQRSARVDMVCGADNKIISVSEPEKCQYQILFETPLVCKETSESEMAQTFVVDLTKL